MENNILDVKALDGHILKFIWTKEITLYSDTTRSYFSQRFAEQKYLSSDFSMSKLCPLKWTLICQLYNNNGTNNFRIGLRRNLAQWEQEMFFCFVIHSPNGELMINKFFEFKFSKREEEHLTQVIELPPFFLKRQDIIYANHGQRSEPKIRMTGMIIAQNCCKARKEEISVDKNVSQLQQDFQTLFKSKQNSDVTLNVGNGSLPAHKFVLTARSPVFRRMFAQDLAERKQNSVQIDDIEKSVMETFLSFLYTGEIEDREFPSIFELYSVADKYEVTTLFDTCRELLISYLSVRTVTAVLKLADMHSDDDLKEFAVKYICDNFSKIETTAEWEELLDTHPRLASYTLRRVSTSISK